ncbi:EscU/YscU/HrcU family type III secretion system export apparatus switch protein [Mesorhizobium sp.]|uniref:EscU/YscU/HrcU family type III secretion system export apparatus switch protein n=1 Tax=Mesorhizobium sp. TaxID=1871066 RepID=UPI00121D408D|nr:EscU/YscU/HrcU family type III secretion system export apparatus switch protein [Mesorhizobium sp.]TIO09363.1 MAG: EscU/YscU/HrcU family type III secretion system export apparatus switch protein [Mesorhizobium sp.]TIO33272.1 MAG: EscU/YscU/HrcU family type III secretion system export apparatus switch protein [Mesorhizobium sp.]TIP08886.1 MAG: EscU/YscU/HrcU family type III secretion system export apparatus switch protein [Mesorhizobium sp.]
MSEEAEEKGLPASDKKLREARRKGQVPQSRDLISGFTLFAALAYLFFVWPTMWEYLDQLVQIVAGSANGSFKETSVRAGRYAIVALFVVMGPLVGIIVVLTLVFGVIATYGPVFSFEPLKPQFDNISPAKGLKKIASLRNVIEFIKSLAKVVMLASLFVIILVAWLQPLFDTPACGDSCIELMIMAVLTPLGIAGALAFVAIGIIDMPIQRWLFLRDMRMTKTEYKREYKDLEGDPLIRQEFQRQRRETVSNPVKLGLKNAILVIVERDRLVALRYVKGETQVPVVVAKGQGRIADEMVVESKRLAIPIVEDPSLAGSLFETTRTGGYIDEQHFSPVTGHLVRLGLT